MSVCRAIAICCLISLLTIPRLCYAQFNIRIDEVKRIDLKFYEGSKRAYVYLANISGQWKCYRSKPYRMDTVTEDISHYAPIFLRDVPADSIRQLLTLISSKDTSIRTARFHIKPAELTEAMHGFPGNKYAREQNPMLAKAAADPLIVNKAIAKQLHPVHMDDNDYYRIDIATKNNITYSLDAIRFANPYYLPWRIGSIKNYNPQISVLFNSLIGRPTFEEKEHRSFVKIIARDIYRDIFKADL